MKKITLLKSSLTIAALVSSYFTANAQDDTTNCENGISAALGYNAFVQNDVSLSSGDTEGPIAIGGDLTLDGAFTVATQTGGTYFHNEETEPASLVIDGKVVYGSSDGTHLNFGYVKIGDLTDSNVHDIDFNNAVVNTRITPGGFDDSPKINLQRNQEFSSIYAEDVIDFDAAFEELNIASLAYSELANNITIENGNKITLADSTQNVLNLTGEELNNLVNFTFNNKPTAESPLLINVDNEGAFEWNVQNQAGIGDNEGDYIIYNFYNASAITINAGGTIMGTVLAPSSDLVKETSGNINGQVIAKSYIHLEGELHQHVYNTCEEIITEETTPEEPIVIEEEPTEPTDPCLSQTYSVNAYPVPVEASGVLNLDIAVQIEQSIEYGIYQLDGSLVASFELSIAEGCNTINVDLSKINLEENLQYIVVVTGETGFTEIINLVTTSVPTGPAAPIEQS